MSKIKIQLQSFIKWISCVDPNMTRIHLASTHDLFINRLIVSSSLVISDFATSTKKWLWLWFAALGQAVRCLVRRSKNPIEDATKITTATCQACSEHCCFWARTWAFSLACFTKGPRLVHRAQVLILRLFQIELGWL